MERGLHNDNTSQIWFMLAKSEQIIVKITNNKLMEKLKFQTTTGNIAQFEQFSMFRNGGHLGWSLRPLCAIMKGDYPRTIPE